MIMTTKRHGTPSINAMARSLKMLEAILSDRAGRSVGVVAEVLEQCDTCCDGA